MLKSIGRAIARGSVCWAVLIGLSISAQAKTKGGGSWDRADKLGAAFNNALLECPDRVWPNLNWPEPQIILPDPSVPEALVWNEKGSKEQLKYVDFGQLPPALAFAIFGMGEWAGAPALSVSLPATASFPVGPFQKDFAFVLAVHEGFHIYSQSTWPTQQGSSRAKEYPANWEPRFLRFQLLRSLVQAFEKGSHLPVYLSTAAYWRDQLQQRFPGYEQNFVETDVFEGSASYMDAVSTVIGWQGCQVSEAELLNQIRAVITTDLVFLDEVGGEIFGHDHYSLGLAAGLIMREQGRMGWEQQVSLIQRPVDLVLEGIMPITPPHEPLIEQKVKEAVAAYNTSTGAIVEPFIEAFLNPDMVKIAIPTKWIVGSFGTIGFVAPRSLPGAEITMNVESLFESPNGAVSAEAKQVTFGELSVGNPCPSLSDNGSYWVVPLDRAHLGITATEFSIQAPNFTAQGPASQMPLLSHQGHDWYCMSDPTAPAVTAQPKFYLKGSKKSHLHHAH